MTLLVIFLFGELKFNRSMVIGMYSHVMPFFLIKQCLLREQYDREQALDDFKTGH